MAGTMDILVREMTMEDYDRYINYGRRYQAFEFGALMIQEKAWSVF